MIKQNSEQVTLTGSLILNELSDNKFPNIKDYQNVNVIELQQLENIDSAGLAYIAQIKSHYPAVCFAGVTNKTHVLAELYGLGFLFKS